MFCLFINVGIDFKVLAMSSVNYKGSKFKLMVYNSFVSLSMFF